MKPVASKSGGYTVRQGDTLAAIAKRHNVGVDDLIEANLQIRNPNLIYPGQTIRLPSSGATSFDREISLASARRPTTNIKPPAALDAMDRPAQKIPGSIPDYGGVEGVSGKVPTSKALAAPGDKGPAVTALQHFLKNAGYNPGPIDGAWGPQTQAAYSAYKKNQGSVPWHEIAPKVTSAPRASTPTVPASRSASGSPISGSGPKTAAQAAHKAGFRGEDLVMMIAIAMAESGGNPRAFNGNAGTGDQSYGLWQINMLGGMGPERRSKWGLKSNEQLYDPYTNAVAAKHLYEGRGGAFTDWSVYKSGAYRQYLDLARQTAKSLGYV